MATVGRGAEQYTVRMPDGLRDRIKTFAELNNRSMNAEIISTLELAYPAPVDPTAMRELVMLLSSFNPKTAEDSELLSTVAHKLMHYMNDDEMAELIASVKAHIDNK